MRDVGMMSMVEDFEEESWVIDGNAVRGVPVKEWSAWGGVGEEIAILEAILAFMDCILE